MVRLSSKGCVCVKTESTCRQSEKSGGNGNASAWSRVTVGLGPSCTYSSSSRWTRSTGALRERSRELGTEKHIERNCRARKGCCYIETSKRHEEPVRAWGNKTKEWYIHVHVLVACTVDTHLGGGCILAMHPCQLEQGASVTNLVRKTGCKVHTPPDQCGLPGTVLVRAARASAVQAFAVRRISLPGER